jgi:hypothetical protein
VYDVVRYQVQNQLQACQAKNVNYPGSTIKPYSDLEKFLGEKFHGAKRGDKNKLLNNLQSVKFF